MNIIDQPSSPRGTKRKLEDVASPRGKTFPPGPGNQDGSESEADLGELNEDNARARKRAGAKLKPRK